MNRVRLTGLIALVCAAFGSLSVAAGAAAPPRASLEPIFCLRAANPLDRAVAVTAVMRPVPGTDRMELRFELERRFAGAQGFSEVHGGDLGLWRHPTDPTLGQRPADVWKLNKEVVNLVAPAVYRFGVTFRWIGNAGQVLGRVMRLSGTCDQPR
jgi:hypothetical protein